MKTPIGFGLVLAVSSLWAAEDQPRLSFQRIGNEIKLSWPAALEGADGALVRPYFEVQRSADLGSWEPIGERMRGNEGESLSTSVSFDAPRFFYRVQADLPRSDLKLAATGAESFGYASELAKRLAEIGQISPDEFQEMWDTGTVYLPQITWDPTTAAYWDRFNANPAVVNQSGQGGLRTFDYRLNSQELSVFKRNGFVVSERLGSGSFADVFYTLWHNDLPVFVSTDAILQAWHRTYDAMLEEMEETYLFSGFETLLAGMANQLPQAWAEAGSGVLKESLLDVDYFLGVARSLMAGAPIKSVLAVDGQDQRIAETLADVSALQLKQIESFFGQCRVVDFSQFQVRGHYTHTERLGRYFRAVIWLGRTDFMVAGGPVERCPGASSFATPREAGSAIVLWNLLTAAGQLEQWMNLDRVIQAFVGWTDSLTFPQLGGLLAGAGLRSLSDVQDLADIERLQADIVAGDLGIQNIRSDFVVSPLGGGQVQLPRSFLVFGQRFVPDSWAFSQTVYDSILWTENGVATKVQRRVPSALDAAFAVLGNDQVVPELVARMKNTGAPQSRSHAERFRDGLPYQHQLAAVRAVMDSQTPDAWNSDIYMSWLGALRELSVPTTGVEYPETMRTRAWAMRTLNTQLASWTQLRHDTILYAKQPYTATTVCYYPDGFVEPRPAFWQRLREMAQRGANLISKLNLSGSYRYTAPRVVLDPQTGRPTVVVSTSDVPLGEIQKNQVEHLAGFAVKLEELEALARKELAQECFDETDELFFRNLIQISGFLPWGSGGIQKYDGWYPQLFYRGVQFASAPSGADSDAYFQENYGANAADALVADVHTDVPDPMAGDIGSVLHEGVGRVNLLLMAVESGADHFLCAGPVLSHYEFEVTGKPRRLTDAEWSTPPDGFGISGGGVLNGVYPSDISPSSIEGVEPPWWTRYYLVR